MPRELRHFVDDILTAVQRIRRYTEGMSFESFAADSKTCDAVVRNLEIIGEAAGRLPESVRVRSPHSF